MKFFIAFVLLTCELFLYVQSDKAEIIQAMYSHKEACIKESHVNKDLVNKFVENKELSDDQHFKCYLKCLLEKVNVLSNTGDLNRELAEELTGKGELEKCRIERKENPCDTAVLFVKCFLS
nr:odorant-binding protein 5 [Podabrus annulatus]